MAMRLKGKHILIAEDNFTNQLVVSKIVEQFGATFEMANDGAQAIALFEKGKFDLALLDIEMPRKTGIEVIKYIRSSPKVSQAFPIIALTAFVLPEHREKILAAGADLILAKPILNIQDFGHSLGKMFLTQFQSRDEVGSIIDGNVLSDLSSNLGPEATKEITTNLQADLLKVDGGLADYENTNDVKAVLSQVHILLSLGGMTGAKTLVEACQFMEENCELLSQDEKLSCVKEIRLELARLQTYVSDHYQ